MDELRIHPDHVDRYVAYGKNTKKLGEKSQEDLVELAVIAQSSQDPTLLELFDGELPSLDELNEAHVENQKKLAARSTATRPAQQGPAAAGSQPASQNRVPGTDDEA